MTSTTEAARRCAVGAAVGLAGLLSVTTANSCGGASDATPKRIGAAPTRAGARFSTSPSHRAVPRDAARVRAASAPRTADRAGAAVAREPDARGDTPPNPLDAGYADAPAIDRIEGEVSYYHDALAGRPTASGEPYDPSAYTAASRTLPLGTVLRVVVDGPDGETRVLVRVNDRGPCGPAGRRRRRILDLSRAAAERLGIVTRGVAAARIEVIERGPGTAGRGCHARGGARGRGRRLGGGRT